MSPDWTDAKIVAAIRAQHLKANYDQRDTLTLELAGFVERSKRAPKPVENTSRSGMHFRRQSNAYRGAA